MASTGVADAAVHLLGLLDRPGHYRSRWLQHAQRNRSGVNQAAVADVLSNYLWDSGEVPDTETGLPRRLKDPISRAFRGQALSPSLLRTFIEAFAMTDTDAEELWDLLLGPVDSAAEGRVLVVRPSLTSDARPEPPRPYRTISLHEYHSIGPDRAPVEHRTVQVIRASGPMAVYRYRFDTSAAVVQVLRGGRASRVHATARPGVYAVDIELTTPLSRGQTASLEYRTVFAYPTPPEPVFRRVSLRRAENVELNVVFDAAALPRQVHACTWADHVDPIPTHSEAVSLDAERSVHRYLDVLEGSGAGFTWSW